MTKITFRNLYTQTIIKNLLFRNRYCESEYNFYGTKINIYTQIVQYKTQF